MNPILQKLALIALDQIAAWTVVWQRARDNPDMTEAEAEQLIRDTQAKAAQISDAWRDFRQSS